MALFGVACGDNVDLDIKADRERLEVPVGEVGVAYIDYERFGADLNAELQWHVEDPRLAAVGYEEDADAVVVYGLAIGTTTLWTKHDEQTLVIEVDVMPPLEKALEISPRRAYAAKGTAASMRALMWYGDGTAADVTDRVVWSYDEAIGARDGVLMRGLAIGETEVTAALDGFTAGGELTVGNAVVAGLQISPPTATVARGLATHYAAIATLTDGSVRDVTEEASWTTMDGAIGTVSGGRAVGAAVGGTEVTASISDLVATAQLAVTSATAQTLVVSPAVLSLPIGTGHQYTAIAHLTDGTSHDVTTEVTWSSLVPSVLAIDATGHADGIGTGASVVTASLGLAAGTAIATVTAATLTRIEMSPTQITMASGTDGSFEVTGVFSDGQARNVTGEAACTSDAAAVASVSHAGSIAALSAGSATITCALGGFTATTAVTVTGSTLVSITVSGPTTTLPLLQTLALTATANYSDGSHQDVTAQATWTSANPLVASVSNAAGTRGRVVGLLPGSAVVTASFEGKSASTTVTVTIATIATIAVSPAASQLPIGGGLALTATALFTDGSTSDVTATVAWTSSNPAVASVDAHGLVTAHAAGAVTITAQDGLHTAQAAVTVTAPTLVSISVSASAALPIGTTGALTATALYSDGSSVDITQQAVWSSSAAAIASVTNAGIRGVVTAHGAGSATITVAFGGQTATRSVTVTAAALVQLQVTPSTISLPRGRTVAARATGVYTDGSSVDVSELVTWASSAPAVASVSMAAGSRGSVTAHATGSATLTATLGAASATATVTVTDAVLETLSIEITGTTSLPLGLGAQLHAYASYSDGALIDVTAQVSWASSSPLIAAVSNAVLTRGLLTTLGLGNATITATLDGQTATAQVHVTAATVTAIDVSTLSSLPLGTSGALHATATYTDGSSVDVTQQATWSSSAPAVASVSTAAIRGVVTAHTVGSATITATFGGHSATRAVTATAATLGSIQIHPAAMTLPRGRTGAATATGVYSNGTSVDLTAQVAWSSSASAVATVSNAGATHGQVTAVATGTATITATLGGVSATLPVTVTTAVIEGLSIEVSVAAVPLGLGTQLRAWATYSDGSVVDVTAAVSWQSGAPVIASVSNAAGTAGLVSALALGIAPISAVLDGQAATVNVSVTAALPSVLEVTLPAALPAGTSAQGTAILVYSDGTTLDVTQQATWSSLLPAIASVTNAGTRGVVTAHVLGATTVQATYAGVTGARLIGVSAAVLQQVQITPASVSLPRGRSTALHATGVFSDGTTVDLTEAASWTSSAPAVASVSMLPLFRGVVSAHGLGSATITAAVGSVTTTVTVAVSSAVLETIAIDPIAVVAPRGTTVQAHAFASYSDGSVLDVTEQATWTTGASETATASNATGTRGRVTGVALGLTTVSAALDGRTATVVVTVTPAVLISADLSGLTSVPRGLFVPLVCTGHYSDGSILDLTAQAGFSSSNPSILSVSNVLGSVGIATANNVGTATVTANCGGIQAQLTIGVTGAILQGLQLSPLSISLPRGLVLPVVALGVYSDGSTADVTANLGWSSSNPAVAQVSNVVGTVGLVTASTVGDAQITAQLGPVSAAVTVHVTPAILESITVGPSLNILNLLQVQLFNAQGHYSDGSVVDLSTQVSWATDNALIAIVSNLAGSQGLGLAIGLGPVNVTATLGGIVGSTALNVGTACHAVVNEVKTSSFLKTRNEFVELYNPCSFPINLNGTRLVYRQALGSTDATLTDVTGTLAPGAYRLYTGSQFDGAAVADGSLAVDLEDLGGAVALKHVATGTVLDSVGYGIAINAYVEGLAVLVAPLGQSLARLPNGNDTNNNLLDFGVLGVPTPKAAN